MVSLQRQIKMKSERLRVSWKTDFPLVPTCPSRGSFLEQVSVQDFFITLGTVAMSV